MNNRCFPIFFVFVLFISMGLNAQLSPAEKKILQRALSDEVDEGAGLCAYTQTAYQRVSTESDEGKTIVTRYDPVENPDSPWRLISIDDESPSESEIMEFKPEAGDHPVASRIKLGNVEKLQIISKEGDVWSFEGPGDGLVGLEDGGMKNFHKKINVSGSLNAQTGNLISLRMALKKPFRHRMVVKFQKFDFELKFGFDTNIQKHVVRSTTFQMLMNILGKAQSISQDVQYSDFRCS